MRQAAPGAKGSADRRWAGHPWVIRALIDCTSVERQPRTVRCGQILFETSPCLSRNIANGIFNRSSNKTKPPAPRNVSTDELASYEPIGKAFSSRTCHRDHIEHDANNPYPVYHDI